MKDDDEDFYGTDEFKSVLRKYEEMKSSNYSEAFDSDDLINISGYYISLNRVKEAEDCIDYLLKLYPQSEIALIIKARMLLKKGMIEEAKNISSLVDEYPSNETILLKAEILVYSDKKEEACALLKKSFFDKVQSVDVYVDVINLLLDANCLDLAINCLQLALNYYPNDMDLVELKGEYYHLSGDSQKAIGIYNRILDTCSFDTTAWEQLGKLYFEEEEYTKAIECFSNVLAIDEQSEFARLLMAHCYFYLKDYEQAINIYSYIHQCYPQTVTPVMFHALCLLNQGNDSEAIEKFKEALPLASPNSPEWLQIHVNMALSLSKLGKKRQALKSLKIALEADPNNVDVLILQGHTYLESGNVLRASQSFIKAMDCPGRNPEDIMFLMAVSMFENNYIEVACYTFEKILHYDDYDKSNVYPYLAYCYWALEKDELSMYVTLALHFNAPKLFELFNMEYLPEMNSDDFLLQLKQNKQN